MRYLVFIAFLFLGSLSCQAAGDNDANWQSGNRTYQQKQYDSAAWYYEQVAAVKPRNAEVYYNLGNAYYRLNKIGSAVLNYQRALQIDPDNKDVKDNLAVAQSRIANRVPEVKDIFFVQWWDSITSGRNATAWAIASLVVFLLFISLVLLKQLGKLSTPIQLRGLLVLVLAVCLAVSAVSAVNSAMQHDAVIMPGEAPLMKAGFSGKPLQQVPEGTIIKIKSEKGDWLHVRLPNGLTGWVQRNRVERV